MKEHVVSKKNQLRSLLVIIALMVITILVIFKDYSITEIIKVIKSIHPFYLIAGVGLMFLFAGCQALNFRLIMRALGSKAPMKYCIEYAYIGNYFGAITPGASGGQPAQIYYMNKDKIHVDISAITIFFMVFASQIVIVLMGGIFVITQKQIFLKSEYWFPYLLLAGALVMIGLTVILSALMFSKKVVPFLVNYALKLGEKLHWIKKPAIAKAKMDVLLIAYRDKAKLILKHPDLFVKVFIVTALQWISYCMVSYLVYLSFGYHQYNAFELMTGQAFINIAVAAVPLPGSVGIAEKSFLNLYGQFYPVKDLPSAMILSRITTFYLPLIISFLVYLLAHHRTGKVNRKQKN